MNRILLVTPDWGCIGPFCWQNQNTAGIRITSYDDLGGEALVAVEREIADVPGFCCWRQVSGLCSAR